MANNVIVKIPKCSDGKFYTILNSEEIIHVNRQQSSDELEFISFFNY